MPHQFQVKTYTTTTVCDHCLKLLWGKQGFHCIDCGLNLHGKCQYSTDLKCYKDESYSDHSDHISSPISDNSSDHSQNSSSGKDESDPTSRTRLKLKLIDDYLKGVSPFPKENNINSSLFIGEARVSGLERLELTISDLLSWKDSTNSIIALSSWIILCLNPILFILTPHLYALYFIAESYINSKQPNSSSPLTPTSPSGLSPDLRYIQTKYESAARFINHRLTWKNSDEGHIGNPAIASLQLVLLSIPVTLTTVYFLTLPKILLVVGSAAFLSNTVFYEQVMESSSKLYSNLLATPSFRLQMLQNAVVGYAWSFQKDDICKNALRRDSGTESTDLQSSISLGLSKPMNHSEDRNQEPNSLDSSPTISPVRNSYFSDYSDDEDTMADEDELQKPLDDLSKLYFDLEQLNAQIDTMISTR
ncbi:hypothetical protein BKA69DRAFT_1099818 [Paraphysoderma sedebokerense]|nr:hypothetical protein BKA69DRAFT_1099818 [Paraphysoderma sedebokerense]